MELYTKLKQFIQSTPLFRARSDETKASQTQDRVQYKHISDNDDSTDLRADLFIGVGACVSMGRIGMLLGPFIFVTLFEQAYFYGIVFNIGILLLEFVAIILLPSRSCTLV